MQYDPHRWTSHLFDIRGSMVREIMGRVSACLGWTVVVVVWFHVGPKPYNNVALPEIAHALIGAALSLLLVFRTNASYDRFWEGRKLWGGIVNETRNLVRQTTVYCRQDPLLIQRISATTIAFAYAAMQRLRGLNDLGSGAGRLSPAEVHHLQSTSHIPLAVARHISRLLAGAGQRGLITDFQCLSIDQNVHLLIGYIGACERIRATPIPFAYAVHLRRALIMYCYTLPFALVGRFGWETIPAVLLVTYILFGIEEIGVEIEDPFGVDVNDLPLEKICQNIDRDLTSLTTLQALEEAEQLHTEDVAVPSISLGGTLFAQHTGFAPAPPKNPE